MRSEFALQIIKAHYAIERKIKELNLAEEAILHKRYNQSRPLLIELHKCLKELVVQVAPSSPIGQAVQFGLGYFPGLTVYLTDARMQIDNNQIENNIRPLALGRKNHMFAGSHESAQIAALMYTFMG